MQPEFKLTHYDVTVQSCPEWTKKKILNGSGYSENNYCNETNEIFNEKFLWLKPSYTNNWDHYQVTHTKQDPIQHFGAFQ